MAYSMNWRPEQDTAAAVSAEASSGAPAPSFGTGSPRPPGPIPGILPPGRQAGATPNAFPPSTTKFSSSYSMNWKPPDMDAQPEPAASAVPQAQAGPVPEEDNSVSSFSALLTPGPTVKLIGQKAVTCEIDGMVCSMERSATAVADQAATWAIRFHPSRQALSFSQSLSLSRAVVHCLYAILSTSGRGRVFSVTLPTRSDMHSDVCQIVQRLGLASQDIRPSTLLRLHAYLDVAFLGPSIQPIGDDRKSPIKFSFGRTAPVYTRYSTSLEAYVLLEPLGGTEGMLISIKKNAATPTRMCIQVNIQQAFEVLTKTAIESDPSIERSDSLISVHPRHTLPEACFIALCHFLFLDRPYQSQLLFSVEPEDDSLKQMLERYDAKPSVKGPENVAIESSEKAPALYRIRAASLWNKVNML